jgi:DNA-binding SARP family transcriptional activator/tetratricopeptide (TPR) repeat protein
MSTTIHHLRLFGDPELLSSEGEAVRLRTRKHLGLLVYLALEGRDRAVARETLMDLFWSDVPLERSRHSLNQALTDIRDRLGRDAFEGTLTTVRLARGVRTDLDEPVTQLMDSPDLSRPLAGMEACGGPAFAHWVDRLRERCRRQLRSQLLADLTEARTSGNLEAVRRSASLLHEVDPLSDAAALALAEQFLLDNDPPSAIRLLREHLSSSDNELGRDPPNEVLLLLRRLKGGFMPRPPVSSPTGTQERPSLAQAEVFVNREAELARLEAAWTSACRGSLTTCLVYGPAGVGKSTLARRFVTSVGARAWPSYLVTPQEIGRNIPFATVSDLIHQLMRDPALSGTNPTWLAEASRVTPGLRSAYPGIPEPPSVPAEAVRLWVAEAILRMLETIADGGPVLIVLDPLQNVDPTSRDVLHMLTRRLEDEPVLLLASMRSEDSRYALTSAEPVDGVGWTSGIEVSPLDENRTFQLIGQLDPRLDETSGDLPRRIAELSQGNPYLTEMLVSDWRNNQGESLVALEMRKETGDVSWRPPETMRLAFARQYEGLTHDTRHVVHLLAVAGRSVPVDELESLLSISPATLDRTALELIDRAIVRTDGGSLGFKNELHRAYVYYHSMSKEARDYHHARLARSLTATGEEDDFQRALEASHHYLNAGMEGEAVEAVCRGAELAVIRGAPKEAERAIKAVIDRSECLASAKPVVLMSAALSAQQQFHRSLTTLASCDIATCDPKYRAMAFNLRAEALHRGRLASPAEIAVAADKALAAASAASDPRLALAAFQVLAEVAFEADDWDRVAEVEHACTEIGKDSGDLDVRAIACMTLGYCRLVSGDFEGAMEKLTFSCHQLAQQKHEAKLHWALNGLGICYTNLGRFQKAVATLQQAMSVAGASGDNVARANSCANLGSLYYELGRFDEATKYFDRASQLNVGGSNCRVSSAIDCNAANLAIALGDFKQAEELLDRAESSAEKAHLWQYSVNVLLTWADLELAREQPELAWSRVDEALHLAGDRHHTVPDMGQYGRLRLHYEWATGTMGSSEFTSMAWRPPITSRLTHRLEVRAFEEWVANSEGRGSAQRSAIDQLVEHRLFGIIARLAAVHVMPVSLPTRFDGESAAQLVVRTFQTDDMHKASHS